MTDCTQPPPNNAGFGHIGWTNPLIAIPKKKTLEYENLTCTYNSESKVLSVNGYSGSMEFSEVELTELRAAMTAFGLGTSSGNTVNYR